jgi:quercetin dioxygenase-like cupin family protein
LLQADGLNLQSAKIKSPNEIAYNIRMILRPSEGIMNSSKGNQGQITGEVSSLVSLVDYQAGAVVSKTLVDKPSGTVTLFAFAAGQGLSEHTAPFDAMVYVFDGEAEVVIAGKPLRLKAGDMTIMPANKPHALRAAVKFKMILTMIKS